MQVCIAMTIPKNPIGDALSNNTTGELNFEEMAIEQTTTEPAKITEEEVKLAEDLLARLGL